MSTTTVFQVVGTVVGFYLGGVRGALMGYQIGSMLGAQFDELPTQYGPRVLDRILQQSTYGSPVPFLFGIPRVAGNVIWSLPLEEVATSHETGGKGGPSQTTVTYSYYGTFAVMFGFGEARAIHRMWADSVPVYNDTGSPIEDLEVEFMFYPGSETQLPDPLIEADMGVGNTPAYRGYIVVVFNRMPLERFGNRLPNITCEFEMVEQTVSDAVVRLARESGLADSDLDVSAIEDIPLRGFVFSDMGAARGALEQLAMTYKFQATEIDDRIVFVPRGGDIVEVIDEDLCAANIDEPGGERAVQVMRAQEMDLPSAMAVTAPDPDRDYQPGSQSSERITSASGQAARWTTAAALTSTENRQLANVLIFDAWAQRETVQWATPRGYAALTPTDPVTIGDRRVRVLKRTADGGVYRWEGVTDDPDVLDQSQASGIDGDFPQPPVARLVPTEDIIIDSALLLDTDDHPGAYVALWGEAPAWRGGAIYSSATGTVWSLKAVMARPGSMVGTALTKLGAWRGPDIFDETNSVSVQMLNGAPSSVTREDILAGLNGAAIGADGRWEIVQYRTATLELDGTYTLSGLLRGRRGTEWAASRHAIGDSVVLLSELLIGDIVIDSSSIGLERAYRSVSIGGSIDAVTDEDFTINAERLKPLSPVLLGGGRDADGNAYLKWRRRTRVGGEWRDLVDASLGETSEVYEVDIFADASRTDVVRTISGLSSPSTTYSAADQTSDLGAVASRIYWAVYQLSSVVGRGHVAHGTLLPTSAPAPYEAPPMPSGTIVLLDTFTDARVGPIVDAPFVHSPDVVPSVHAVWGSNPLQPLWLDGLGNVTVAPGLNYGEDGILQDDWPASIWSLPTTERYYLEQTALFNDEATSDDAVAIYWIQYQVPSHAFLGEYIVTIMPAEVEVFLNGQTEVRVTFPYTPVAAGDPVVVRLDVIRVAELNYFEGVTINVIVNDFIVGTLGDEYPVFWLNEINTVDVSIWSDVNTSGDQRALLTGLGMQTT